MDIPPGTLNNILEQAGAAGATLDEVKELVREAMEFHLEGMRQNGDAIPAPSATTEYIRV